MILLLAADVRELEDTRLYGLASAAVSGERRERADRCRFDRDKRLCLGVELLLQYGLFLLGRDPKEIPVRDENGKPQLASGVCFNMSHTGNYALCALSDGQIGCDVETVSDKGFKIAAHLAPEEYADILARQDRTEQMDIFYQYWVLKESYMKATGLGMQLPLRDFRICPGDPITVFRRGGDTAFHFAQIDGIPGCKCAVCAREDCSRVTLQWVCLSEWLSK